ncbi:MAG TPA: aldo/keto reductase [Clostridia bacterium]|nr:aldo/keto reductase [Clostridia bacterium]
MEKRSFGKTGLLVSPLGFGAGPIGYLNTEQAQVERTVQVLLDAGVNLIDTAAAYPGSEEAIGKAVAARRKELVLVSKCGQQFDDLPGSAWSAQVIEATVNRSLRRLNTDCLDVMLLHSCDIDVLQRGEALAALARARDEGKIRFFGYSGDNEAALYAARQDGVSVVETSVNICDQANLQNVLPVARQHNVGINVKRPLANTAWRPVRDLKGIYQDYAQPYRERFAAMGLKAQDLGFTSEADWPEIALRFTLSHPGLHVAIIGTTNPDNARHNIAAAAKGPLPKPAFDKLQAAFQAASRDAGWPGLT